ncbi:hypothetical protein BU17DRAFT_102829 [Hysterangium stoloniferum]|nr:hypothetical protein BU17DRAFT_102829 [Hysterangium stoloniferum]
MALEIDQGSRPRPAQKRHDRRLELFKKFIRKHNVKSTFATCVLAVIISGLAILLGVNNAGTTDIRFIASLDDGIEGVLLIGHIYQIKVDDRTISVSWLVGGCGSFKSESAGLFDHSPNCGPLNVAANIYIDRAPTIMYDPKSNLLLAENTSTLQYSQATNEFQMTHLLNVYTQELKLGNIRRYFDQQYLYPFELFQLTSSAYAVNPDTNNSLAVAQMAMTDFSTNFAPFSYDYATLSHFNGALVESRFMHLDLRRTTISIIFVMMLYTVNWALTLMVTYITVTALVSTNTTIGEGILILPVTVILTLPALRGLFVDSPPFGRLIDVLGLFMQMIIVAVCSIILLVGVSLNPAHATNLNE